MLKKATADHNVLSNYRPISNLAYSSKLIERVVSKRLEDHCLHNKVNLHFQSAYKQRHSTETALTRVQNDLLMAVDSLGGAILVLLDLSAAFDTIDHAVLIRTLKNYIGVSGSALAWFMSYLSDREQSIKIANTLSTSRNLPYGVPQGSVLGPQLFSLYTLPLHHVIEPSGMQFHMYADDTQLYIAFNPKDPVSSHNIIETINSCTNNISTWMKSHFLKLNSDKTELLVMTKPNLKSHGLTSLSICGSDISVSPDVRDLGVQYDSLLKMETHIKQICKKAYYQISLIHKVRQYLTEDSVRKLVQANITSLLDYCNGLLIGLPCSLLSKLQRVQNCAARVVKCVPQSTHITPILKELHWLPIKYRIDFKVILLTFKALNGLAPPYLSELLTPYQPSRALRSMNSNTLVTKSFKCKTYGGRSFANIAPQLWNSLPSHLRTIPEETVFRKTLKTYLFNLAFN